MRTSLENFRIWQGHRETTSAKARVSNVLGGKRQVGKTSGEGAKPTFTTPKMPKE